MIVIFYCRSGQEPSARKEDNSKSKRANWKRLVLMTLLRLKSQELLRVLHC